VPTLLIALAFVVGAVPSPAAAVDPQPIPPEAPAGEPQLPTDGLMLNQPGTLAPGDFEVAGFEEQVIWDSLVNPMAIEFAPDGRVFVAEKRGLIKVFTSLDDPTPSTYADVRANVHDFWDRGMLGMALDPDFVTNGRMYLSYTYDAPIGGTPPTWGDGCSNPPGATADGCVVSGRLSVLTHGTNEQVLINDWCQQYPSHSMGDIVFDAEGALILSSGDGANFNAADWGQWGGTLPNTTSPVTPRNPCGDPPVPVGGTPNQATGEGGGLRSQDIRTTGDPLGLSGTVIRVSPTTGAPARSDNPRFDEEPTTNGKRIIAYGLRNPFRMTINPVTGDLWLGDVGWGTWEEINRVNPDGTSVPNFGWPCREGTSFEPPGWDETNMCTSMPTPTAPSFAYQHGPAVGGDCALGTSSISGLAFYPGGAYPDEYDNALFFTDYSRRCIWVLPPTAAGGAPNPAEVDFFGDLAEPVQLKVGPGGDLFYADFGTVADAVPGGSIRRITFQADNDSPTADIDASPTSGDPPLQVDFDASGSTDPNDDPLTYAWDFGDNDGLFNDSFEEAPEHTYTDPGSYLARVRVDDGHGGTDTDQVTINVANDAPNATITSPTASFTWSVGQTVSFAGTATDPDEGTLPASAFEWELIMQHCPDACHSHPIQSWSDTRTGSFTAPDHAYPSHLELRLTVTDEHGSTDTATVDINPKTVTLQMRSAPSGLRVSAAGRTAATPFNVTVIRGSAVVLGVPSGQTVDGFDYTWTSWSQGGPKTQTITANASATYTARFDGGFDDVPPGAKFAVDIAWLFNNGITAGCDDSPPLFCPNGLVTRGQMATFLVRALDLPSTGTDYFTDDEGSVHEANINRLRAAGITAGCTPTTYCPAGLVTRAQMATFLVRAFDLPPTGTDYFTDDNSSPHEPNINRLRAAGITYGCTPTTFCPNGIVTRGQMAAFLHRALGDQPSN
jgi:glucose/arabinose dehydrogenase/PKD repeat protein